MDNGISSDYMILKMNMSYLVVSVLRLKLGMYFVLSLIIQLTEFRCVKWLFFLVDDVCAYIEDTKTKLAI